MPQTLILPAGNGLLHLAYRYEHGLQLSIENFGNWLEAAHWCVSQGVEPRFQIAGHSLPIHQWNLLRRTRTDQPQSVDSLYAQMCAADMSIRRQPFCVSLPLLSPGKLRTAILRLEENEWITVERVKTSVGSWLVTRRELDPELRVSFEEAQI